MSCSRHSMLAATIAVVMVSSATRADVRHVDDDAPPDGDGLAWASAYRCLQDALADAAGSGGAVSEIRVARGTYAPDRDEAGNVTPGDRAATFQLLDGVAIKGGYAGLGAPDPDARDIDLYVTILTGDLLGNDGPNFHGNDENSLHVVTGDGTDATAALDGVTVTAGNADLAPETEGAGIHVFSGSPTVSACTVLGNAATVRGAGMFNKNSAPTVTDCLFRQNAADEGAGLHNEASAGSVTGCRFVANVGSDGAGMTNNPESAPVIESCEFTDNDGFLGGGMQNHASDPTITDCLFEDNAATWGGGMLNIGGAHPEITGCTFRGNSASGNGGGLISLSGSHGSVVGCVFTGNAAEFGGGAVISESNVTFDGCTFGGPDPQDGNVATASGGGMYNYAEATTASVIGCDFINNTANFAGGMFNDMADTLVLDCTFTGNSADSASGAMGNFEGASPIVTGCTFTANTSVFGGAMRNYDAAAPVLTGCRFEGNTATDEGGAMVNAVGSAPTLTDCVFVGNWAPFAGAIDMLDTSDADLTNVALIDNSAQYAGGAITGNGAGPTLVNCTVAGNTAGVLGGGIWSGAPVLANCVVWSNSLGQIETTSATVSFSDVQGGYAGAGNIDADPLFVDPGSGNYRLQAGSSCLDAGLNAVVPAGVTEDLDGQPRFVDDPDAPDCPQAPGACGDPPIVDMGAYEFQGPCPWDLDGSGDVGVTDFLDLLAQWGSAPGGPPDFDGDGDVGVTDFLVLLANWGPCP